MSREAKASGTIRIGCPTSRRFSRSTSHNTMRDVPAAIGWTVNLQEGLPSAFCQRWKGFSKGFRGGVGERQRRHGYAGKSLLLTCGGRDFQGFPGRRCRKATPTRIRREFPAANNGKPLSFQCGTGMPGPSLRSRARSRSQAQAQAQARGWGRHI